MVATPGISIGYWKARNTPAAARSRRVHGEQVLAVPGDRACRHLVVLLAGEHVSERRLAGAVRAHDGMDLALGQLEVEAFQDLAAIDIDVKVLDLKHYDVSLTRWD